MVLTEIYGGNLEEDRKEKVKEFYLFTLKGNIQKYSQSGRVGILKKKKNRIYRHGGHCQWVLRSDPPRGGAKYRVTDYCWRHDTR